LGALALLDSKSLKIETRAVDAVVSPAQLPTTPALLLHPVAKGAVLREDDLLILGDVAMPDHPVAVDIEPPQLALAATIAAGDPLSLVVGRRAERLVPAVALSGRQPDGSLIVAVSAHEIEGLAVGLAVSRVVVTRPVPVS